jgi:hypothetical protein
LFDSLSSDELEFVQAIERYKASTGNMFPAWTEILQILKDLGYRKAGPRKRHVSDEEPPVGAPQETRVS